MNTKSIFNIHLRGLKFFIQEMFIISNFLLTHENMSDTFRKQLLVISQYAFFYRYNKYHSALIKLRDKLLLCNKNVFCAALPAAQKVSWKPSSSFQFHIGWSQGSRSCEVLSSSEYSRLVQIRFVANDHCTTLIRVHWSFVVVVAD